VIFGRLEHWSDNVSGPIWQRAFEHILSLGPDSPEGITELMGKDMYARIMSYDTGPIDATKLEAHRSYIDIQYSLVNGERIDWFPLEELVPIDEYNPEKDARHYSRLGFCPLSSCVQNGTFAIFFPEDGHMPKLVVDQPRRVKKVVVKVKSSLIVASNAQQLGKNRLLARGSDQPFANDNLADWDIDDD